MTFNLFLLICAWILVFALLVVIIVKFSGSLINNLPTIHKKLFNLKMLFLKKKIQHYFYTYEKFKETVNINGRK